MASTEKKFWAGERLTNCFSSGLKKWQNTTRNRCKLDTMQPFQAQNMKQTEMFHFCHVFYAAIVAPSPSTVD